MYQMPTIDGNHIWNPKNMLKELGLCNNLEANTIGGARFRLECVSFIFPIHHFFVVLTNGNWLNLINFGALGIK